MTRVGIVGSGRMGSQHAAAAAALGAEISWVVDPDSDSRNQLGQRHGARSASRLSPDFADQVDNIVVAVPPAMFRTELCSLLSEGRSVLIEKPLAVSRDQAIAMVKSAGSNRSAYVGYMNRFRPAVKRLRARRVAGEASKLAILKWVGTPYKKDWWLDPELSGGPFTEQACHLVDLAQHLVGKVRQVEGTFANSSRLDTSSTVSVTLTTSDEQIVVLTWSCDSVDKSISASFHHSEWSETLEGWEFNSRAGDNEIKVFEDQMRAFLDPEESPESPLCSLQEAAEVHDVVEAIGRSLSLSRPVSVASVQVS